VPADVQVWYPAPAISAVLLCVWYCWGLDACAGALAVGLDGHESYLSRYPRAARALRVFHLPGGSARAFGLASACPLERFYLSSFVGSLGSFGSICWTMRTPLNFSLEATGAALFVFNGFLKFAAPRLRFSLVSSACASVPRWA
jgi:hypothetical protein